MPVGSVNKWWPRWIKGLQRVLRLKLFWLMVESMWTKVESIVFGELWFHSILFGTLALPRVSRPRCFSKRSNSRPPEPRLGSRSSLGVEALRTKMTASFSVYSGICHIVPRPWSWKWRAMCHEFHNVSHLFHIEAWVSWRHVVAICLACTWSCGMIAVCPQKGCIKHSLHIPTSLMKLW